MKIAASILACNPLYLGQNIKELESAGVDLIHVDIMDGHYVNNFTFGIHTIQYIAEATSVPVDVHLEVMNPERYIKDFANAGASIITVQLDVCKHPIRVLEEIRKHNVKAGLAINPHIGLEAITFLQDHFDYLVLMSVEPGFGAQKFERSIFPKLKEANRLLGKSNDKFIGVDGGINRDNISELYKSGAELFIIGTSLYEKGMIQDNLNSFRTCIGNEK